MNENSERLQALEAENKVVRAKNKNLQAKVESLTTSITPPPGFSHVHYEINTNPSSAPRQTTPATLTSNAHHLIFDLRSSADDPAIPEGDQAPEPVAPDSTAPTSPSINMGAISVRNMHVQGIQIKPSRSGCTLAYKLV
ncbi:hypothetical protein ACOSQ4_024925 [Xanthoceras sorbifolium]